jgi:hypothetical protein
MQDLANLNVTGHQPLLTHLIVRTSVGGRNAKTENARRKRKTGLSEGRGKKRRVEHLADTGATTARKKTEREAGEARARATLAAQVLVVPHHPLVHPRRMNGWRNPQLHHLLLRPRSVRALVLCHHQPLSHCALERRWMRTRMKMSDLNRYTRLS